MTYTPDPDEPVAVRCLKFANVTNEAHRPFEIADAIDSEPDYVREVCNRLHREGWMQKFRGDLVIGHPMPHEGIEVLSNSRPKLLRIVKRYADDRLSEARSKPSVEELRNFIVSEIATEKGHSLGVRKVYFGVHADSHADELGISLVTADEEDTDVSESADEEGPDASESADESSDTTASADD
ncbi:hypothetical protein GWG54_19335 [Natronococcus sp. JC468]|uniref:hypothetical protein n=1 Tax=Natronococcus sp. JC468 TaxID=1961921 RepID=UPI00143C151B|nr:hypothetical protein [Natronococcus sp. JC468]NKE37908.1 hypothetical protein [Natronococcus sp. JC468]